MRRIVTVTPNPAVDVTYAVDSLIPGETHRVGSVRRSAGGKGINVARVLHSLGRDVLAVAPVGGAPGEWLVQALSDAGLAFAAVPIAGTTRQAVTVVDGRSATVFNEPGPKVTDAEWSAVLDATAAALTSASVLVVSGSVPADAPADVPARLVELARQVGVPAIVDTSGPALLLAAEAGPALVKPNAAELAAATAEDDVGVGAAALLRRGAERVVVSLGRDGLVGLSADECWRVRPEEALAGNPTGAGDAAAAGLAIGLADGTVWPETLRHAAALGAAAVLTATAGEVDIDAYRGFLPELKAEECDVADLTR